MLLFKNLTYLGLFLSIYQMGLRRALSRIFFALWADEEGKKTRFYASHFIIPHS